MVNRVKLKSILTFWCPKTFIYMTVLALFRNIYLFLSIVFRYSRSWQTPIMIMIMVDKWHTHLSARRVGPYPTYVFWPTFYSPYVPGMGSIADFWIPISDDFRLGIPFDFRNLKFLRNSDFRNFRKAVGPIPDIYYIYHLFCCPNNGWSPCFCYCFGHPKFYFRLHSLTLLVGSNLMWARKTVIVYLF